MWSNSLQGSWGSLARDQTVQTPAGHSQGFRFYSRWDGRLTKGYKGERHHLVYARTLPLTLNYYCVMCPDTSHVTSWAFGGRKCRLFLMLLSCASLPELGPSGALTLRGLRQARPSLLLLRGGAPSWTVLGLWSRMWRGWDSVSPQRAWELSAGPALVFPTCPVAVEKGRPSLLFLPPGDRQSHIG